MDPAIAIDARRSSAGASYDKNIESTPILDIRKNCGGRSRDREMGTFEGVIVSL